MRIAIKDYQAIRDTTLEINKGITAIIGPTNSGKSSIIRAIQGAINNQSGTGFINYEAEESRVIIEDRDNTIEWVKSKKGPAKYIINGEEVNKIGRQQNEEVATLINMEEVDIGGVNFRLNFWNQMEKAFLMDRSPNQLFNFMSQSNEQEQVQGLNEIKQDEQKQITDLTKKTLIEIDVITADIIKHEETIKDLEKYETFDLETFIKIEEAINNLNQLKETRSNLVAQEQEIRTKWQAVTIDLFKKRQGLTKIENLIKEITAVDTLNKDLTKLLTQHSNLTELEHGLRQDLRENKLPSADYLRTIETKIKDSATIAVKVLSIISALNKRSGFETTKEATEVYIKLNKDKLEGLKKEFSEIKTCPFCGSNLTDGNHKH